MKYKITAAEWGSDFRNRFGKYGEQHELTDSEVVSVIMQFGRASIYETNDPDFRELYFCNGYD